MNKHHISLTATNDFEIAKKALAQLEIEVCQSTKKVDRKKMLPYRLSNAQYFVHSLYYDYGFKFSEIAKQTGIKHKTIKMLFNEIVNTIPEYEFSNLLCFYCAVQHKGLSPESINTTETIN